MHCSHTMTEDIVIYLSDVQAVVNNFVFNANFYFKYLCYAMLSHLLGALLTN